MAGKHLLEFDHGSFSFKRVGSRWWRHIRSVLIFLALTFALSVFLYLAFSLLVSTNTEKRLRAENKAYGRIFPQLEERKDMIGDVIAGLQYKDNAIYEQVFRSVAPNVDPVGSLDSFFASDTIPDTRLYSYTGEKADRLLDKVADVDEAFRKIADKLVQDPQSRPPLRMPLPDISYPQVGASVGDRYNPFYKTNVRHTGIDLLSFAGDEVYAPADGEVVESRSLAGSVGTYVKLRHSGGYETYYSHLGTRYVKVGQKVVAGQKIGTVGMTGNAYAPHLHYEVYLDGVMADPINYFFASVTPLEYADMLYMSSNTRQSMD